MTANCAPRGNLGPITPASPQVAAKDIRVFFATDRTPINTSDLFGSGRSPKTNYGQLDINIPLDRDLGTITYPNPKKPDLPAFHVSHATIFPHGDAFRRNLNQDLGRNPADKTVIVFVHGYNTNFAEGVYLYAQIKNDLDIPQTSVFYSWPSAGTASGYVDDIGRVLFARDGFEGLLDNIAKSDATDIIIVAHSMGSLLALESVRQAGLRPGSPALGKVRGIFLIAPDVGEELFASQRETINPQTIPICIIASSNDSVLGLSAWLNGNEPRLGQLTKANAIVGLTAAVIDISQFSNLASNNHMTVAQSTSLIDLIRRSRSGEIAACATQSAEGTVNHVASN